MMSSWQEHSCRKTYQSIGKFVYVYLQHHLSECGQADATIGDKHNTLLLTVLFSTSAEQNYLPRKAILIPHQVEVFRKQPPSDG